MDFHCGVRKNATYWHKVELMWYCHFSASEPTTAWPFKSARAAPWHLKRWPNGRNTPKRARVLPMFHRRFLIIHPLCDLQGPKCALPWNSRRPSNQTGNTVMMIHLHYNVEGKSAQIVLNTIFLNIFKFWKRLGKKFLSFEGFFKFEF